MKIQIKHDTAATVPDRGSAYMHCARCLDEWKRGPRDVTPREFARQQVAITDDGDVQIWCTRHDINIDLITFDVVTRDVKRGRGVR